MHYFLYTKATGKTGRALVDSLKSVGVKVSGGTTSPNGQVETLVRWGATGNINANPKTILNEAKAISAASNKLQSLKTLAKAKILVPPIFDSANDVKDEDFPVFGRKLHHIAGADIVLCMQKSDLKDALKEGCTYFTKYIVTAVEYRIHIFNEKSIKASQKILTEPERHKDPWIRNFDEGFTFHAPHGEFEMPKGMRTTAKAAVKELGLNFGAVDVILGADNKVYVLEVNTAPGLQTDDSLERYTNQFKEVLK